MSDAPPTTTSVIIQLRSRRDPSCITDPFQLAASEPTSTLNAYLNATLHTSAEYIFFYGEEQLHGTLEDLLASHKLSAEETLVIDYTDPTEQPAEAQILLDAAITDLTVQPGNLLWARTLNGRVFEISTEAPPKECGRVFDRIAGPHGVSGRTIYLLETATALFDIPEPKRTDGTTGSVESEIVTALASDGSAVAVALDEQEGPAGHPAAILVFEPPVSGGAVVPTDELELCDKAHSLIVMPEKLYWIESLNLIFTYDRKSKERDQVSSEAVMTNIAVVGGVVYASTGNNMLVVAEEGRVVCHELPVRLCTAVAADETHVVLLAQHRVLLLDRQRLVVRSSLHFKEQANAILLHNGLLYVANGQVVSIFKMSTILN